VHVLLFIYMLYIHIFIVHSIIHLLLVCNYVRKTSRASYGSTALSSALEALENGQPLKATARNMESMQGHYIVTEMIRLSSQFLFLEDINVSFHQNMKRCLFGIFWPWKMFL